MNKLFGIYSRCFPSYPTTREIFERQLRPDLAHMLTRREDGKLAGFALVHGGSIPLLCVDEPYRGRGIGSALLAECETYIRSQGGEHVTLGVGPHYLLQGVPTGPAVDFFEKRGYIADWTSINMELGLDGFDRDSLTIPPAPEGLRFRFAEESDRAELLTAVEAAEEGWVGIFADCADPILLAELDGKIAGFEILTTSGGYFVKPGEQVGCIGCVGVIPARRERGIGMAMVAEGAQWLKGQGCTLIELRYTWLDGWYGKLGFHTVSRQWMGEKKL